MKSLSKSTCVREVLSTCADQSYLGILLYWICSQTSISMLVYWTRWWQCLKNNLQMLLILTKQHMMQIKRQDNPNNYKILLVISFSRLPPSLNCISSYIRYQIAVNNSISCLSLQIVRSGGSNAAIWGLYARWHKTKGNLMIQVGSLQVHISFSWWMLH